ncbi:MAG: group III truncated hemoglobin [Bacteroidota bacterium]
MKGIRDIATKEDVVAMVDRFYAKVNQDALLAPIFNDFSKVDWQEHLPKMYRFWNTLIFGNRSYKGHPFAAHIPLPISKSHFDRWVSLFEENMDELFLGEVAEHTKRRARSIAHIFESKLYHMQSINLKPMTKQDIPKK